MNQPSKAPADRLSLAALDRLPAGLRPAVRPDQVRPGIVHLGLGAFHRGHQAVYTQQAITAAGGDWGIIGVAPRSRAVLDALAEQDRLYSVLTVGPAAPRVEVIGVLAGVLHAGSAEPEVWPRSPTRRPGSSP